MKCNKKRILIGSITAFVILVAIVACVLLFPELPKKTEKKSRWGYPISKENGGRRSLCNGKECSDLRLAEEAVFERSCSMEECVLAAARMITWMDKNVDPCEDFYNFSCGNFIRTNTLPEGWESYGSVDVSKEEIDLKLKSILEEPIYVNDTESLKDTKKVYKTCTDLSHIEEFSEQDMRRVLSNAGVGEWPILQPEWKECRLDLEWRMAKLNAMGIDSLFNLDAHFQGNESRLQAVLRLARPLVTGICGVDDLTEALDKASEHKEILQNVLELLGVQISNVTTQDIDDIFQFDFLFCKAIKVCWEKPKKKEKPDDRFTLHKLADIAPQINWIRWRNIVFSELRLNFPHDKQNIYVDDITGCIDEINDLLLNSTSKVVANYLTWKFVFRNLGYMGKSFRQLLENHHQLVLDQGLLMISDRWIPRWRQCVLFIQGHMPMAVLKEYREVYHRDEDDKEMDDIVTRVKNEFRSILKDSKDLLENDRIKSYHKIDKIQVEVAYPYKEDKFYDKFYSEMGRFSDSFLGNGMKLLKILLRKVMEGVSKMKTIEDMEYVIQSVFSPFDLRAHNSFRANNIVITLSHLMSHSVTSAFPKFKTMSTFGWTIGHELTHGFDLTALDGSYGRNWTWWPTYALKQAQKKAQCFLEFFPYPKDVNERDVTIPVLNEDMCDNQGMYLAFKAYLNYLNQYGDEEILPGLPFSNEKLFFMSYAQQFCEIRPQDDMYPYGSPGRHRVNQVLKNFPAFSEAFRCPRDAPMNSPKCGVLWT